MGSAMRDAGKEHIPNYPRGWITIRILQFILAIITLGLCSYLVAISNRNIIGAGFYVEIFTVRTWLFQADIHLPLRCSTWKN